MKVMLLLTSYKLFVGTSKESFLGAPTGVYNPINKPNAEKNNTPTKRLEQQFSSLNVQESDNIKRDYTAQQKINGRRRNGGNKDFSHPHTTNNFKKRGGRGKNAHWQSRNNSKSDDEDCEDKNEFKNRFEAQSPKAMKKSNLVKQVITSAVVEKVQSSPTEKNDEDPLVNVSGEISKKNVVAFLRDLFK